MLESSVTTNVKQPQSDQSRRTGSASESEEQSIKFASSTSSASLIAVRIENSYSSDRNLKVYFVCIGILPSISNSARSSKNSIMERKSRPVELITCGRSIVTLCC